MKEIEASLPPLKKRKQQLEKRLGSFPKTDAIARRKAGDTPAHSDRGKNG